MLKQKLQAKFGANTGQNSKSRPKVIADVDDLVIHDTKKKFIKIERNPSKDSKELESFDNLPKMAKLA